MTDEKIFKLEDLLHSPVRIHENLFQWIQERASTQEGPKNYNCFITNPKMDKMVVSYQYDPDFLFGVDTSYTHERMLNFLLGNKEERIFRSKEHLDEFIETHYQDDFHNRYAYREEHGIYYLELTDDQTKVLFKRSLLNYMNHFYLTFTFAEDDQSQQLENDKIIEILKEGDSIYLPYTKEMFDAIDVNPLLLDRELFIYEDGFIYQGDDAHRVYEELYKSIPSLSPVEDYTITYNGKLSEEVLRKLYRLQKKVIVSESFVLIHGELSDKTIRELDNYGVTFTLLEDQSILLEVGNPAGTPITELYPTLLEFYEKGLNYYRCVDDCIYNGALARVGHIHYHADMMCLVLGKTSFMTYLGFKDPRESLYSEWKHSFFDEEEIERLQSIDRNEELNAQALMVRLESEDVEAENYYERRLEAINDYLARSMSIHRVSIAGNLITKDGYLLYEPKNTHTGVSVYGAGEIKDEAVTYYHNSTDLRTPSIYHNFEIYRNFQNEFSRHAFLQQDILSNEEWDYYGISMNGYQGESSNHITPIQFHVLGKQKISKTFDEMHEKNPILHGIQYTVDEKTNKNLIQKRLSILQIICLVGVTFFLIYAFIRQGSFTLLNSAFILVGIVFFLSMIWRIYHKMVLLNKSETTRLFTQERVLQLNHISFEKGLNENDTLFELLHNLYLCDALKESDTMKKKMNQEVQKGLEEDYLRWKEKALTNKRNARINSK